MSIRFEIKGLERLQRKIKELPKAAAAELERALIAKTGEAMNEAQRTVPVVTGRLRSTAFVRKVARNQYSHDLRFGYEAPYAIYVHERPLGRGYKWMERAFRKVFSKSGVNQVFTRVTQAAKRVWNR